MPARMMLFVLAPTLVVVGVAAQTTSVPYIAPGFDILAVLPPAPVKGDARDRADRAIFKKTRALLDGDRWRLAVNDVDYTTAAVATDFSCAAGISLTSGKAPATIAFLAQASREASRNTSIAKDYYRRLRPFQVDRGRRICQRAEETKGSYDYPSGHATLGWTWATLLAALIPDRATAILVRGRAYGESRIVCGVHNASAVDAGRLSASSSIAAMLGSPKFQADFAAARAEIDRLRASAPVSESVSCAAERKLVSRRVY